MPEPRYFEDFHVGEVFETPDRPVSEGEIVAFAEAYDPPTLPHGPGLGAQGSLVGHSTLSLDAISAVNQPDLRSLPFEFHLKLN